MKISELISKLQELQTLHGDLPVMTCNGVYTEDDFYKRLKCTYHNDTKVRVGVDFKLG